MSVSLNSSQQADQDGGISKYFPDLKPTSSPALISIYGCGFSMAGHRDNHPETGTYVKTHVLTIIFIPIMAIGAYRVADAPGGGWYFVGKDKLSTFGKRINLIVIAVILALIAATAISNHLNSPQYRSKQLFAQAEKLSTEEKYAEAMAKYVETYNIKRGGLGDQAVDGYSAAVTRIFNSSNHEQKATTSLQLISTPFFNKIQDSFPDLYENSMTRAKEAVSTSTLASLNFLAVAERISRDDSEWITKKLAILEEVAQHQSPVTHDVAETLSKSYEDVGNQVKIISMLEPIKDSLADTEMARRLGSSYLSIGKFDNAITLLEQYTKTKKDAWLEASKQIDTAYERAYQNLINKIQNGKAPRALYEQTEKLSEEAARQVWQDYIAQNIEKDAHYGKLLRETKQTANIPTGLMDLGIAHLRYAQTGIPNAKTHLESAESTLLFIGGYAGESPEYQLFLGQVYYWLGKNEQGKEIFTKLETKFSKNSNLLMNLARTLREIGKFTEAKVLAEKSYNVAQLGSEKYITAEFVALLSYEAEERISWLEKADQTSPSIKISLNSAKGDMALIDNDKELAIELYTKAIEGYEKMSNTTTSLNNCALLLFRMHNISGNRKHYTDGLAKMDEALSLAPNDPILNGNASRFFFGSATKAILKKHVEDKITQSNSSLSSLRMLHINSTSKQDINDELSAHPHFQRGITLLNKALQLAPQSLVLYQESLTAFSATEDITSLELLLKKLKDADLDYSSHEATWKESLSVKQDTAELKEQLNIGIDHFNERKSEMTTEFGKAFCDSSIISLKALSWPKLPVTNSAKLNSDAKSIYTKHPNPVTWSTYSDTLYLNSALEISAKYPNYKTSVIKANGQIGDLSLVLVFLLKQDSPMAVLDKLPKTKKFLQEYHIQSRKYQQSVSAIDALTAMLIEPLEFEELKAQVNKDPVLHIQLEIADTIYPYLPRIKLNKFWNMILEGNHAEAQTYLKKAAKEDPLLP